MSTSSQSMSRVGILRNTYWPSNTQSFSLYINDKSWLRWHFLKTICASNFLWSWEVFCCPFSFRQVMRRCHFSLIHIFIFHPVAFMSCDSLQWSAVFFSWLGCFFFFVTWVNISSNMLILIVVMETIRTNHKNFQVVLLWHSYMPQQNDNHLKMVSMLQWHMAVSCDHEIAWDHIFTISIMNIINIKQLITIIFCNIACLKFLK